jgi:protein SCO1
MKFIKKIQIITIILLLLIPLLTGCTKNFPFDKDLAKKDYSLLNQDSLNVTFPSLVKGKTTLIAFIYTHCADICPMTTHNLYLTQEELDKEGIENINYVVISFDPERDTPEVLKKYARIMELDLTKWNLLTGNKSIISDLMRRFDVTAIPTDSSYSDDGELNYTIMHTDRIALVDKDAKIRKYYKGSTANISELVNDVKELGD